MTCPKSLPWTTSLFINNFSLLLVRTETSAPCFTWSFLRFFACPHCPVPQLSEHLHESALCSILVSASLSWLPGIGFFTLNPSLSSRAENTVSFLPSSKAIHPGCPLMNRMLAWAEHKQIQALRKDLTVILTAKSYKLEYAPEMGRELQKSLTSFLCYYFLYFFLMPFVSLFLSFFIYLLARRHAGS